MEWVTGESLPAALTRVPEAATAIGAAVADTLDRLGRLTPPDDLEPAFGDFIHACLFEQGAGARLGEAMTSTLWQTVLDHAALVDECAGEPRFVHGDFQGDNLLLRQDGARWSIVAVLDWEWARKGSILGDLGSLLRREGIATFVRGLETELAARRQALPARWERAAKLKDLMAQCEKLTFPRHRGEVTERTLRTIARYLSELAMPGRP
jgi:aminoglycoside phosphotransferase (APT) family kinase protein